ncbi:Ribonuclease P protein component 4 [Candidatus Bilamarchaeum dharawalense]|uniref:Ribonuclease P protein component 4 n=1 Tax=Candidatus Bilamarchaeum dharawalense TaxID=2885759 RepID=A0A5E4LNN7_9ARCH|nr:Ribonuclease P protein component 4 [Candidatus Bilamarchaeum dharawalense]
MDSRRKNIIKSSVSSSIEKLLNQSRTAYSDGNLTRSIRYVRMAFELLKKHKVKLPAELKNSFCRKCCLIWIPDKTLKIKFDTKNNCLRVVCNCGYSKRL